MQLPQHHTTHHHASLILNIALITIALLVGSCDRHGDPRATLEINQPSTDSTPNNAPPPADEVPAVSINVAPVADAGQDATVNGGAWLGLDGSRSVQGSTPAVHYMWTQIGGPIVALQPVDAAATGFIAPTVTYDERLEFELAVSDDTGETSVDRVAVTVLAQKTIYVVVDQATLTALATEIETFRADVQAGTGHDTRVVATPSAPAALRDLLRSGYEQEGLRGAFLIGAVPMVYLQNAQDSSILNLSDTFFRALYCPLESTGDAHRYMIQSAASVDIHCLPNIWVSRIKSTRPDDALTQIGQYLDKNHRTRSQPDRWAPTMSFVAGMAIDDTTNYATAIEKAFTNHPLYAAESVALSQADLATDQKAAFLAGLATNLEILKANFHGAPIYVWFQGKNSGDYIDSIQVQSLVPRPKFIELESCSTGAFDMDNYFAGELLFGGDTLLVQANPSVTSYLTGSFEDDVHSDYRGYGLGWSPAQLYTFTAHGDARHFLGDPTVTLRPRNADPDRPRLDVDAREWVEPFAMQIDFPPTADGDSTTRELVVTNAGNSTLTLIGRSDVAQLNTVEPDTIVTSTSGFLFTLTDDDDPVDLVYRAQIAPGESRVLRLTFTPAADPQTRARNAEYRGVFRMMTNAPDTPAFTIEVRGTRM